ASLMDMLGSNENGSMKKPNFGSLKKYLSYVVADLKNCDLAVASVLKKFSSADVFKEKSKEVALPQNKEKKKDKVKVTLSDENDKLIDGYIASYADAENMIYIGIRPEDIHFADGVKSKKVEAFDVEVSFVEMLGSELCIYIDLNGSRLIMKTDASRTVKTGDNIKLCFDTAKIKLFDPVSCQRILR
ncbi:MAG: TOBE domain-containing protein, partial [Roseburia sp.]|nr:TOBE domain-containing protein [Roseburia sp.]